MPRPGTPFIPSGALDAHKSMSSDPTLMPYTVTIKGPDQLGPVDPDTGQPSVTPGPVDYTGGARLHPVPLNEDSRHVADDPVMVSRWYMRVPLGTVVYKDRLVNVTDADGDYADATLVGRTFRILDHTPRVFGTELRCTVREEPVPEGG